MSTDAKLIAAAAAIVIAILGAAWIVSDVMITLASVIREDLHELRDTLERVACGELAQAPPLGDDRHGN